MEVTTYSKYLTNFVKLMGGPPSEEEECSMDQLACLKHRLDERQAPFCDFGVFTPFGDRLQRKLRLTGMSLSPD
eukprot:924384-Amphidinium_carterae.1